ncbi:hypothetical protein KRX57_05185 [Weeksellaceae bacterium TAE3-ERU29]|nr:hypothetical protein [Weeksellaceae bacterium TAE3-ERU29]
MKKKLLLSAVMLSSIGLYAQVGINTTEPKGTLDVSYESTWAESKPQGLNLPNVSSEQRLKFEDTPIGMLIYNTDRECIEMFRGIKDGVQQWQCLPDAGSAQAQNIAITAAGFEGQYISGVALTNANKVKFKLENNSFNEVNSVFGDAVTIHNGGASIRVTECKYQKLSGGSPTGNEMNCTSNGVQLLSGESALLKYKLNGEPQEGNITATFNKLGLQADQSTQVGLGSARIANQSQYAVSLKNKNVEVIQGKINNGAEKLTVQIPYTNGKGSYNAVSVVQTTASGQDGDINNLTLTIPAGTFGVNGTLTATIEVGGADQEYKVRQLEPGKEYVIATFPINMNGTQYNVELKGIGGIPDKHFDDPDHKFVYVPIEVTGTVDGQPYKETWLNLNLGADYANITKTGIFNPGIKPEQISKKDYHAYGSLFQFGRDADGHELVKWTDSKHGTRVKNVPWYSDSPLSYTKANDPCPNGYHTPKRDEWLKFHKLVTGTDYSISSTEIWNERKLALPAAGEGFKGVNSYYFNTGISGVYWSRSMHGEDYAWHMRFGYDYSKPESFSERRRRFSVRCLKDKP